MAFSLGRTDTLESIPIEAQSIFVGSADWKVDLCLAGDGIDEVHCELAADPHGIRVESLSPDGVLVNGQTIQSALLFANDQLAIGPFEFRVERAGIVSSRPVRELPTTLHAGITTLLETDDDDLQQDQPERPVPAVITEEDSADGSIPGGLWLVRRGSLELGPMDWSEVENMLERGELTSSDLIRHEDAGDWRPIESLIAEKELQPSPPGTLRLNDAGSPNSDIWQLNAPASAGNTSPIRVETEPEAHRHNPVDSGTTSPREPSELHPGAVAEPQYFVQRQSNEEGPLPRHAVQELISRGHLPAATPVRLEWNSRWSTAVDLGFAYPDQNHISHHGDSAPAEASKVSSDPIEASYPGAGIRWGLMAPFFYARTMASSLQSLSLKQLALVLLVLGIMGFTAQKWMNRYARTALTGTVLLDDQPLGDVVVTFTGMKSGEVAAGVADDSGRFRVLTISGKLSPGPYRITVRPEAGPAETVPHGDGKQVVPDRYALLATSDVTVDVTAGQKDYTVPLARLPGSSAQRNRRQRDSNN